MDVKSICQCERPTIKATVMHDAQSETILNLIGPFFRNPLNVSGLNTEAPFSDLWARTADGASMSVGLKYPDSELWTSSDPAGNLAGATGRYRYQEVRCGPVEGNTGSFKEFRPDLERTDLRGKNLTCLKAQGNVCYQQFISRESKSEVC